MSKATKVAAVAGVVVSVVGGLAGLGVSLPVLVAAAILWATAAGLAFGLIKV